MFKFEPKGVASQRLAFLVITIVMCCGVWYISPQKGFETMYIMTKLTIGALIGYWIHMLVFRNFRPSELRESILQNGNRNGKEDDSSVRLARDTINTAIWSRTMVMSVCILSFALAI
jgi:hypothetical protein